MKVIEALKKTKELQEKAEDLRDKVANHCAHMSYETPVYPDQKKQIREWMQSHSDVVKEILRLRLAIQRTNLATDVTIELDGKQVTKTIAEWIHRRGTNGMGLAYLEAELWRKLTDRGLREGHLPTSQPSSEGTEAKIVRCYDPAERDDKVYLYRNEPQIIDRTLEVVNAVTDLIE